MPEYRTPGVYVEELSSGPRPVQASATTDTGFVAILTLPASVMPGRGPANHLYVPMVDDSPQLTWNRALAFRPLQIEAQDEPEPQPATTPDAAGAKPAPKAAAPKAQGNRLKALVADALGAGWDIDKPNGDQTVTLRSASDILRIPVRRSQVSTKEKEWDLAFGADEQQMLQLIASKAVEQGIKHSGNLSCVDPRAKAQRLNAEAIQERLLRTAPVVHTMDAFEAWRQEFAATLFAEILVEIDEKTTTKKAMELWESLHPKAQDAWIRWVRLHPGMLRLELAVQGFFQNGGKAAYICIAVQTHGGATPARRSLLESAFDGVKNMAMICAPGLDYAWQQEILDYAGPRGRGDLFAVLEAPRYLMTRASRSVESSVLNKQRWMEKDAPYESALMEAIASPQCTELRYAGYSEDSLLDRCVPRDESGFGAAYGPWVVVDNPLATGAHDRYIIAPPSGHVAGVIAATDLKAGGGVHKAPANEQVLGLAELVTSLSDREQEPLNTKGINIIRHRPGAGIRIWGARTVAHDPLWTYINVRRLFLFVERSVRDAVNWAVFLPNNSATRGDLRTTIIGFLHSLFQQKMLDGANWKEAFSVRCDETNNPDTDVRLGLLTVDVEIRPVFPAEFVRIRFRQSRVRGEISEG